MLNRRQMNVAMLASGMSAMGLSACGNSNAAPASRFVLLDGSTLTEADLKGKVTLINFWATTCVSCVKEMPALANTFLKYKDKGYDTIAVAMKYDPPDWVLNFANSRQLPFKVALDNTGDLAKDWGDVKLTPTSYLVDSRGTIVKKYLGEPDMQALHQLIESLLAKA